MNKKKLELSIFTHNLSILNASDLFKMSLMSNFCASSAQVKANHACSPRAAQLVTESELQRPSADTGLSVVTKTTRSRTLPTCRQLSLFLDGLGQGCDRKADKRQIKSELASLLTQLAASCFSQKPNQAPASSLSWRFPCITGFRGHLLHEVNPGPSIEESKGQARPQLWPSYSLVFFS